METKEEIDAYIKHIEQENFKKYPPFSESLKNKIVVACFYAKYFRQDIFEFVESIKKFHEE